MGIDGDLQTAVRRRYGQVALDVLNQRAAASCCGEGCGAACSDPISGALYNGDDLASVPAGAAAASLGCGNPTALIALLPGQTVLDLGSGGGIDVLLSARRVGPTGKAFGVDMTDEMLALARQNAVAAGATNVEFRKGAIEALPLDDASIDVVISNCVINLSTDKDAALREAFRVLKPGGRFAVSDVVVDGPVPDGLRREVELWIGCLAGALDRDAYAAKLAAAGFQEVRVEPTRYYALDEVGAAGDWLATQSPAERQRLNRAFFGAFVRATKPPR